MLKIQICHSNINKIRLLIQAVIKTKNKMTPKEKAKQLVGKFYINIPLRDCDNRRPHKYALIAVDECLQTCVESMIYYWQEVKQEIEKL